MTAARAFDHGVHNFEVRRVEQEADVDLFKRENSRKNEEPRALEQRA